MPIFVRSFVQTMGSRFATWRSSSSSESVIRMHAVSYAVVSIFLMIIWTISEYNNAGGWPTDGFSQSSSIPHVWNIWIIYPVLGLGVVAAIEAWNTYGKKPISESEIRRGMDRLTGGHRQV